MRPKGRGSEFLGIFVLRRRKVPIEQAWSGYKHFV
jgi:hypothetical protein